MDPCRFTPMAGVDPAPGAPGRTPFIRSPCLVLFLVLVSAPLFALPGCRLLDRNAEEEEVPVFPIPEPEEESAPLHPPEEVTEEGVSVPLPAVEVGPNFWAGERTVGYELSARFPSAEAVALLLDRAQPLSGGDGRRTLGDILVSVDYRGGPLYATWRVVGAPEIVEPYLRSLRDTPPERSPVQELGILALRVSLWRSGEGAPVIPEES